MNNHVRCCLTHHGEPTVNTEQRADSSMMQVQHGGQKWAIAMTPILGTTRQQGASMSSSTWTLGFHLPQPQTKGLV